MPVPSFLSSFADKAQSALNASPLAAHLPSSVARPPSPDSASQPTANQAAAQGGAKSHTLESLQYQFRTLQQQYSTTSPVQRIITAQKGVAIDFDSVSRNSKAHSKEFYTWGQSESDDLKDVTDRLAYLNFVQGSLATSLSAKLDAARAPFKALRDAETQLQPRRNIRAGLQLQIARFEHEQQKAGDKRIADLREQLRRAESEDQQLEREVELLKRKAVRESEQIKWDAIREYGEKLVLLSQAAPLLISALPPLPPTPTSPYAGAETTGRVRASLQRALDNHKAGQINLTPQFTASDLDRSDTRSFGESHASELSSIHSVEVSTHPAVISTLPSANSPPVGPTPAVLHTTSASAPPIDPSALNQSPTLLPSLSPAPVPLASSGTPLPIITPTIAETGVPVSAGPEGPGPASGSLHDIKGASETAGPLTDGHPANQGLVPGYAQSTATVAAATVVQLESTEEEKKRFAAAYFQRSSVPAPAPSTSIATQPPRHETAEEEKKRLEREERERILHANTNDAPSVPPKDKDEDLPPYQEPGLQ